MTDVPRGGTALVLVLALAGCGEDPRTAIVGRWQGESGVQDLEFSSSGSAAIADHKTGRRYEGACSIDDDAMMTCRFDGFAAPVVREVDVDGDTLVLTERSGREEIYRRR